MSGEHKIGQRHRGRLALVYPRQSTAVQVREHAESTMRQYALADVAAGLGWDRSQVLVLDGDLGLSGRSMRLRGHFKGGVGEVFRAFEATGSCCGVVRAFRDRRFPTHGQSWTGEVTWMRLRQSQARAILRNPAYAGACVSGRVKSERQIDAGGFIRTRSIE